MKPDFKKLLESKKKKGDVLSPLEAKARMSALGDLKEDMMGSELDKLKGLKKVTIASNSPKGLEKGINMAKEIVGNKMLDKSEYGSEEMPEDEMMGEESAEHEAAESPEMESAEESEEAGDEEMSKDELLAEIERLKAKLDKAKA
jgi:hypothetical protein